MAEALVVAHLSDTHFGYRPTSADRTRRILDHLASFDPRPDVIVVTGDIADHGADEEYAEASDVFGAWPGPAPVRMCPGNHDVRAGYAGLIGLAERAVSGPINRAHEVGDVLFCLIDSMVPANGGERIDHGILASETLAWLDAQLGSRAPGQRAVIALHHPPVVVHSRMRIRSARSPTSFPRRTPSTR